MPAAALAGGRTGAAARGGLVDSALGWRRASPSSGRTAVLGSDGVCCVWEIGVSVLMRVMPKQRENLVMSDMEDPVTAMLFGTQRAHGRRGVGCSSS